MNEQQSMASKGGFAAAANMTAEQRRERARKAAAARWAKPHKIEQEDKQLRRNTMNKFYCYFISPIDFNWEHQETVREMTKRLFGMEEGCDTDEVEFFINDWKIAKEMAIAKGWEGDFREDPIVFWVPTELRFEYGFVIKQHNNGNCFVISPVEMPWLPVLD